MVDPKAAYDDTKQRIADRDTRHKAEQNPEAVN